MKILILGDNRVFECEPGVTLGKIMDDLTESLKQSKRIIRRVFLDEEELNLNVLQDKVAMDVSEFEHLTVESITFGDAALEMLTRINETMQSFEDHLFNTIEGLKRFSPNAVQMFSDFSDASAKIFESIDNSLLLIDIDADEFVIGEISFRKVLDDIYEQYKILKDRMEEESFKDEYNLKSIIEILEDKIAPKIATVRKFLEKLIAEMKEEKK
ncbi:MAG: hypothetical protein K8S87_07390 [Planctomycetes bacterium]|nr:hypothetical protein [Planctomycetota bacterium]